MISFLNDAQLFLRGSVSAATSVTLIASDSTNNKMGRCSSFKHSQMSVP